MEIKEELNIEHYHWLTLASSTLHSGSLRSWQHKNTTPITYAGNPINEPQQLFFAVTLDNILRPEQIIVWSMEITNTVNITLNKSLVGTRNENYFESNISYDTLKDDLYDCNVIQYTSKMIDDATNKMRYTVTFKTTQDSEGKNALIWWINPLKLYNEEMHSRIISNVNIYESVDKAASSGATPEEMREVLNQWGEEELIPGIGEQIEEKVPGAVEEAIENIERENENKANTKIEEIKEQLQETINPYFENTQQISEAIHSGFGGVFGYTGTDAVITLPAANNPMADGALLWPETQVDLGYWWFKLPSALRAFITAYSTFVILYACLTEMLDTINTILIHRELLGRPDK